MWQAPFDRISRLVINDLPDSRQGHDDERLENHMIKLLLVDDVELFLELERSFLSREIFEIVTARSGREALEKVRRVRPDLVLLDLFMPEIDGAEVCRSLKADPDTRNIPVIMTTSEPQEEPDIRKRCFEAGCDDFIPKPLRREELLKVIGDALQLTCCSACPWMRPGLKQGRWSDGLDGPVRTGPKLQQLEQHLHSPLLFFETLTSFITFTSFRVGVSGSSGRWDFSITSQVYITT